MIPDFNTNSIQGIVFSHVGSICKYYPKLRDDLVSEAKIAYFEAAKTYKPGRSRFTTYFWLLARRRMWDFAMQERGRGLMSGGTARKLYKTNELPEFRVCWEDEESFLPTFHHTMDVDKVKAMAQSYPVMREYLRTGHKTAYADKAGVSKQRASVLYQDALTSMKKRLHPAGISGRK